MTTAHIASLPERITTLEKTVNSLIDQVDMIYVALNNYETIPEFLKHDKIKATLEENLLGDAAKFLRVSDVEGYVLVCDDDLIYPSNYACYMRWRIDEYNCVVSLLGKVYSNRPIKSFRNGYTELYRCLGEVDNDHEVDVCGTGAMAYHTKDINVNVSDFPMRNMADIWMARIAKQQGVKLMAVAHPANYVKHVLYKNRIWVGTRDDAPQTEILNTFLI